MYKYTGKNEFNDQIIERKTFQDELEAINYAHDHATDFPNYQVIDLETDEVIASPEIDQDIIDGTLDSMFPDGDEYLGDE